MLRSVLAKIRRRQSPTSRALSSTSYWTGHNVTFHRRFASAEESLRYFHWRNDQYFGYLDLMPVAGQDGKRVLDYGCGPGNDLVGFGVYSKPSVLVGMDVSSSSLAQARERVALHGIEARLMKIDEVATTLPLESGSIDYVHSSGVLHHVPDPLAVMREFKRILAPGGAVRVMVYNYDSLWMHLYVNYVLRIDRGLYPELDSRAAFSRSTDGPDCPISNVYQPAEFLALARAAGLAGEFVGAAVSCIEADYLPGRFKAMQFEALPDDSRKFLQALEIDKQGLPRYNGTYAGVDGVYLLSSGS